MTPIHSRSTIPHPSLRVRYGWMAVVGFVVLCSASALDGATFPLMLVLLIAWALWRSDRDNGRH